MKSWKTKSISMTSLLVIVLMITMSCWNLFIYYKDIRGKSAENIEFQQRMIDTSLEHIEKLLGTNQLDAALVLIDANYSSSFFDFFIVQKNGKPLTESSNIGNVDISAIPENAHNFEIKTPGNTFFFYRKKVPPYDVVLGYFPADTSSLTMSEILQIFTHNVQDTVLLFLAIMGFVLREYFRQIKFIKSGKREDFEAMNPLTKEGKLIKDLFMHASNLTRQKIELEVPDGVEIELSRGTKSRTVFTGGIIRVDLNQYSNLCKERGQALVDSLLSPVFSDFREVAQRYGYYEIADEGDERVFYLRSEDSVEATRLALATIRGMFELGKFHSNQLETQHGIKFIFKAAYSFDDLLFLKEDGKYKLKGNAHIISKRCIGTFKERTEKEYVIALPKKDFVGCEMLCEKSSSETFDLQGLGTLEVQFISSLVSAPASIQHLKYFSSNSDISAQLSALQKNWSEDRFWALYKTLKDLKIVIRDVEHRSAVLGLLKEASSRNASSEIIASLIMLLPKLTSAVELNEEVVGALNGFMRAENPRVRANALEALGDLKAAVEEARNMLSAKDNRTKANALLILGKNEMNAEVEKSLRKFLKSETENDVLSGLYVLDKLFAFHSNRDLTFYRTSSYFKDLFLEVRRLQKNPSERITQKANLVAEIHGELLLPS